MENTDPGNKTYNNEQGHDETSAGQGPAADSSSDKLNHEIEQDQDGSSTEVERARNFDNNPKEQNRSWNEDQSLNRSLNPDELAKKKQENKDRNSDVAANRYPADHPDNHHNRGNIELRE
jgi:hypothetical protein